MRSLNVSMILSNDEFPVAGPHARNERLTKRRDRWPISSLNALSSPHIWWNTSEWGTRSMEYSAAVRYCDRILLCVSLESNYFLSFVYSMCAMSKRGRLFFSTKEAATGHAWEQWQTVSSEVHRHAEYTSWYPAAYATHDVVLRMDLHRSAYCSQGDDNARHKSGHDKQTLRVTPCSSII